MNNTKNKAKIPEYLEYLGKKYKYTINKAGVLVYTYTPSLIEEAAGSIIIVKHRPEKRWCDQFYVLMKFIGTNISDYCGGVDLVNLKGLQRMAKPIINN